ncbi:MAG: hypothetical protein ACOYL3_06660 [Desulfuromonadaceae bacterium]
MKPLILRINEDVITQLKERLTAPQTLDELARDIVSKTCDEIAKDRSLNDIFPNYIEAKHSKTDNLEINFTDPEYKQVTGTAAFATAYEILCEKDGLDELLCRILHGACAEIVSASKPITKTKNKSRLTTEKDREERVDIQNTKLLNETIGIYGNSKLHSPRIQLEQEKIQNTGNNALIILEDVYYPPGVQDEMFKSCTDLSAKERSFTYLDLFENKTITKSEDGVVIRTLDNSAA